MKINIELNLKKNINKELALEFLFSYRKKII
jgi:hypothetical protein